MNNDEYWADATAAIERLGVAIRSSFMSASEALEAFRPNDVSGEQPKYDPFNARAMWGRPCPQKMYRDKRQLRMVQRNPVAKVNKPKNCRGRRNGV